MSDKTPSPQSVVVPVEPTPKMLAATWDHEIDKSGGIESQNTRNARIWSAMLAAAPAPPAMAGGEVGLRAHFKAMQAMATAYLTPEDYRDRDGKITLHGDHNNTEQWKQGQRGIRAEAFANDMVYMLDGPEERAALSPEAPAREGVVRPVIEKLVDDVAKLVLHGKVPLDRALKTRITKAVNALTPRHEAPASPSERELDLLDTVMRAGGIVKTAAALPDKAAHLSLLTDALNRADAILTEGLNGAPVSHEAPAEGAGELIQRIVRNSGGFAPEGEDLRLCVEALEAVFRARSSAPEASS